MTRVLLLVVLCFCSSGFAQSVIPTRRVNFLSAPAAAGCTPGTNTLVVSVVAASVNSANGTSYITPSFTTVSNATYICFITVTDAAVIADGETIANSGTALTWWRAGRQNFNTLGSAGQFISAFVTQMPSGTAGFSTVVTLTLGNAGTGADIVIVQVTGASQTAAWGTNAIVQTTLFGVDASANPTNQFAAPSNNGSNSLVFAVAGDATGFAPTLNWTELWETNYTTPTAALAVYSSNMVPAIVTTVTNTASSRDWATILIEVKAGTNCTPPAGDHGNLTINVAGNNDDAQISPEWTFFNSGESSDGIGYFGSDSGTAYQWVFNRFVLSAAIPAGMTVTNCQLKLRGRDVFNWTDGVDDVRLSATDSANAAAPTTAGERPVLSGGSTATTTTVVTWADVTWSTSGVNTSTNIASIINELVTDNSGLANGVGIVIWTAGANLGENGFLGGELFEHAGTEPAQLIIQW